MFSNSRSDFAKSRSAIYSVFSKFIMIKQCNAITTKTEFNLYRKSRENRDKKKWIGKIYKITKKLSRRSFVKQSVGKTSARRIHFILHVAVISGTDLGSLIAVISSILQKLQQSRPARVLTFRSNYDYTVPVNCFKI